MPPVHSSPYFQMNNPAILSLLRLTAGEKRSKSSSGGLLKMFKLFPMLTSGCKMVALLGRPRKPLLKDNATTGTIFGYRKGRLLRGVSMGAGVLPSPNDKESTADGELTYIRARFERVVGSQDSEALYMNPDGAPGPELSIFFVRAH
ncbi:hypothetical protein GH714_005497 [Hevea brasiliensis]|uniref:Protein MIZU-KUSSEI 1 n=1 Tax=Hevea brasiliensis TaxID=3981 RepID=A0A6A6MAI0_HEVBR|nr:hypothetical protein GH714_005497 [Hevea brasiliensis]